MVQKQKNASAGEQGNCAPAPPIAAPAIALADTVRWPWHPL